MSHSRIILVHYRSCLLKNARYCYLAVLRVLKTTGKFQMLPNRVVQYGLNNLPDKKHRSLPAFSKHNLRPSTYYSSWLTTKNPAHMLLVGFRSPSVEHRVRHGSRRVLVK